MEWYAAFMAVVLPVCLLAIACLVVQVLASEMYASGVEALEDREFVEAADYLAQCLQFHAERSGDTSIEAAVIGLKYAEALLGCARMKGTNVLGTMKVSNCLPLSCCVTSGHNVSSVVFRLRRTRVSPNARRCERGGSSG